MKFPCAEKLQVECNIYLFIIHVLSIVQNISSEKLPVFGNLSSKLVYSFKCVCIEFDVSRYECFIISN